MGYIQYAVLNDIHIPYESRAYYKSLEEISKLSNLRALYLNGDVAEIESVSSHPKGPSAQKALLGELETVNQKFDTIQRMFPDLPVYYICGNHEYRIWRYIRDVAPALWGMLECPKLLKFDERPKWKFIDYGPKQWVQCGKTKLWLRHEPLAGGQNHARGTAIEAYVDVLYGHTHQEQTCTKKKHGPIPYLVTARSGGWLGDIRNACFDYRGSRDNWVLGWNRIETLEGDKHGDYDYSFRRQK